MGLGGRSERLLLAASPNARENAGRVSGLKPRQHQPGFLANVAGTPVGLGPFEYCFQLQSSKGRSGLRIRFSLLAGMLRGKWSAQPRRAVQPDCVKGSASAGRQPALLPAEESTNWAATDNPGSLWVILASFWADVIFWPFF